MMAGERIREEQLFHDRQARERARRADRSDLRFRDAAWLEHETWIREAFAALGPLAGARVLDFGCGHGMASVVLARHGAQVTAFDLSGGYLREAAARAAANEVRVDFLQADGERLPFAKETFDAVWGNAILHHLDLRLALSELRRVLKPGGRAVFCEPWGGNPLLNFARRRLPYPGKERTLDEAPLTAAALPIMREYFPTLRVTGHQLFGMLQRLYRGPGIGVLHTLDTRLLRLVPGAWRWSRYVVLAFTR